jgi:hypothetical protein
MAVSDHDGDVGLEDRELLEQLWIARVLRLKNRNLFVHRNLLDRRRNYLARSTLRLVGLGDHADDLEAFANERPQRRLSEVRRAPE